jgi:plastocyanin
MIGRRQRLLLPALFALAFVLPGAARAATHTVTIEGMQFSPATLTVRRGDTVVWQNKDVVPHTATAKGLFDSGAIAVGGHWSRVLKKPGRHAYACTFHPGMKAAVVVQ